MSARMSFSENQKVLYDAINFPSHRFIMDTLQHVPKNQLEQACDNLIYYNIKLEEFVQQIPENIDVVPHLSRIDECMGAIDNVVYSEDLPSDDAINFIFNGIKHILEI